MATNFPANLDVLVNPQPLDSVEVVPHSKQHADANDAIEALEVKVGADNSTNPNSLDYKVRSLENNYLNVDAVEDLAAGLLTSGSHTNITVAYDDNARKINLTATYDNEEAIAAIATAIVATGGIDKTYDSVAKTITLSINTNTIASQAYVNQAIANLVDTSPALLDTLNEIAAAINDDPNFSTTVTTAIATALSTSKSYTDAAISALGNTSDTKYVPVSEVGQADGIATLDSAGKVPLTQLDIDEKIQDVAAGLITSGNHTNLTASYDDVTGKINFTAVAQLTQEQVQDAIGPLFAHGTNPNISVTYDDVANKMILEAYIPPSTAKMSSNAPSSPIDGQFWFDTDEARSGSIGALKVWNALNSAWENVTTNLSVSTTNTWTSKNTFTNGIIIGLDAAPLTPVHGQIYYNKPLDKLKVWDGLLWQDIQGSGGGGGGLTLIPTDTSVPPSTFFVGLISPPAGATTAGDLWIDVDDDAGATEFVFAGPNPPAEGTFGMDTLWIDTDDPDLPLIYSDNEPPSYSAIEGDFWVDLDDTSGQSILSSTTPPNPLQTEFWLDLTTEEGEITYSDLFKNNAAQITNFASLPAANLHGGMIAYVSSEASLYVAAAGQWIKIFPTFDSEALIWAGV
jgi:hypothetical protein